jgi:ribosomal protein S12 methylthiotransferase accessory factor
MTAATAIVDWVLSTPLIDGVFFGSSDGETEGPPICAVAVAGQLRGYGKGLTQSQALASAVGEVLELQAAAQPDPTRLILAPFADIAAQAFDPRWLCLYSPMQYQRPLFPFKPFDPLQPIHWIQGRWSDTGERVYLPAFAVYLSDQLAPEALCQVTSNGLAAGISYEAARDHAVLELYERDAFLLSWLAQLPKTKVDPLQLPPSTAHIIEHLQTRGARTEVYLLAEGPPALVALAVGIGDGIEWPAYTLGLGAAQNSGGAIEKAILELGQTSPSLARIWRRQETSVPARPQDIKTLREHALYYCDPSHRSEFQSWLAAPAGLSNISSLNVRIATVDITPSNLIDSPFQVVRALGKGLQPIYCGYGFEQVACERLTNLLNGASTNSAPCPIY